jgi:hypothetical protein
MFVQFGYGFITGSLGLLTDSIHMLFDCAGLAVGLTAAIMSRWPPSVSFPYGYGKVDSLSGFANGIFLMSVNDPLVFLHRANRTTALSASKLYSMQCIAYEKAPSFADSMNCS